MNTQIGSIFNIQKFSLNDGPGIRTTVFLKGCMLRCLWCHNPESHSSKPQLMLYREKCIGCGECVRRCPRQLHSFSEDGEHRIDRQRCAACSSCVDGCAGALEIVGREASVEDILREVEKDRRFYEHSGGGMTVSGGEPLMQPEFTLALLREAKGRGLHTCLETCGYAPWEKLQALIPFVDLFLWDVKETDDALHREFTGVSAERILDNLRRLSDAGASIVLRCPLIPGYNDRPAHLAAIAALAEELTGVIRVDVEPYHPLGKGKSESLGKEYAPGDLTFPENETVQQWIRAISAGTAKPVAKS